MATCVYLVRHAHAPWSHGDDHPLSSAGLESAERLADRLSDRRIAAIYSSPLRRSLETVTPLADRLGLRVEIVPDLRERRLLAVPGGDFEALVEACWRAPEVAVDGGESNAAAQSRGLAAVGRVAAQHDGEPVVVATHGNLLTLILNGFDPSIGFEFWRRLSMPDVYTLEIDGTRASAVERMWDSRGFPR